MDKQELKNILDKHLKWLRCEDGGERAYLSGANLSKVLNIDTLSWDSNTAFYPLQCPETGTYTAYKKANNLIVEAGNSI